jgi:25S rRNA (adenine2142-N1)-methyltransferase
VGALKADNYRGCRSWIENTPIDLNAQDSGITQQDFLSMSEDENACKWDVLSLSLVLNFVPDPRERGTEVFFVWILFTLHDFRKDAPVGPLVS